ncbi:MAG: hypothetical protein AB1Z23_01245 [Eubacteriales bacterium]
MFRSVRAYLVEPILSSARKPGIKPLRFFINIILITLIFVLGIIILRNSILHYKIIEYQKRNGEPISVTVTHYDINPNKYENTGSPYVVYEGCTQFVKTTIAWTKIGEYLLKKTYTPYHSYDAVIFNHNGKEIAHILGSEKYIYERSFPLGFFIVYIAIIYLIGSVKRLSAAVKYYRDKAAHNIKIRKAKYSKVYKYLLNIYLIFSLITTIAAFIIITPYMAFVTVIFHFMMLGLYTVLSWDYYYAEHIKNIDI